MPTWDSLYVAPLLCLTSSLSIFSPNGASGTTPVPPRSYYWPLWPGHSSSIDVGRTTSVSWAQGWARPATAAEIPGSGSESPCLFCKGAVLQNGPRWPPELVKIGPQFDLQPGRCICDSRHSCCPRELPGKPCVATGWRLNALCSWGLRARVGFS